MDEPHSPPPRLTVRSVALGLGGGTLVSALVPYNDNAMANTPLIGNNLPLAATVLLLIFVTCVNAPLHRWRPARAWSSIELAVAYGLMLAMASVPSAGMMRFFQPALASPFRYAVDSAAYREVIAGLGLASWVFPTFDAGPPARAVGDPIAVGFVDGWSDPSRSPYRAWVVPFLAWAIFCAGLAWALICTVCIVLRQWRENQHLAFPLATVQLSLLEAPAPGRAFNRTLASRAFWIVFAAVFLLHVNNGLAAYFPKQVPVVSRGFDFTRVLTERPWVYADAALLRATVYFSMVGLAFFLSSPVAFSLWGFVVLFQVYRMILGTQTGDSGVPGVADQRHGVGLAMLLTILWLGRRHWALVARQALRGVRPGEPRGTYLSYRAAAWGLIGGAAVMVGWLVAAGATTLGSLVVVVTLLSAFVLLTRLIAETGLIHAAMPINNVRPFDFATVYADVRTTPDTLYAATLVHATFYDHREPLPVYASHAMRCLDETRGPRVRLDRERQLGRRFIALVCVGLAIAYTASFWSGLWTHYNYPSSLDIGAITPIDSWATRDNPRYQLLDFNVTYATDNYPANYDRAANLGLGFGIAAALSFLRLHFAWWPLHPVGYLIYGTFPSMVFWFSLFLGWLAKIVVLRLGSAGLYQRCKPAFLALIFGEAAAGAAWLLASHALHLLGIPYRSYLVLPP